MSLLEDTYRTLTQSEWLPHAELQTFQRKSLERLLRHAFETVPFYRNRLDVLFPGDGSLDWRRWGDVPFLEREEIQENAESLVSSDVPASHGDVNEAQSSGSTGRPILVKKTALSQTAFNAVTIRLLNWHEIDNTTKLASIKDELPGIADYPEGKHETGWAAVDGRTGQEGRYARLNVNTSVHLQAEWLVREQPDYLHTFPSVAAALAAHFKSDPGLNEGLSLKRILTHAEVLNEETRALCRDVFAAEITDCYSSIECGYFALQCDHYPHYHVQSEVNLVEILDSHGRPCSPGETGHVVSTPLFDYAMPLIRYRQEDLAVVGEPCDCGRSLPVLKRVVGRTRNLFRFPDGSSIVPELKTGPFEEYLQPRQWQVVQTGPLEIEVRIVPQQSSNPLDFDGMTAHIHRSLRSDLLVKYSVLDNMPEAPGGKHEAYICALPDTAET